MEVHNALVFITSCCQLLILPLFIFLRFYINRVYLVLHYLFLNSVLCLLFLLIVSVVYVDINPGAVNLPAA